MLPKICRLLQGKRDIAFDKQAVEIFLKQGLNGFGQVPGNLSFQPPEVVENGKRPVLKYWVRV